MNDLAHEDVGFIKYSGSAVPHGVIDAGSAGMALIGLDEALRFFNEKQSTEFAKLDYEIPVRTEGGSWIAIVLGAMGAGAGTFALSYLKKAGEKMAENDCKDIGLKDVLKKSMSAMQYLVRLVKHTKKSKGWETQNVLWRENGNEVGIPNDAGEVLFIPTEFFNWYASIPQRLIVKMTTVVRAERTLSIGVMKGGVCEEVTVGEIDKILFSEDTLDADEDFLFPELEHGKTVKLEGKLIRGSEASNSVGFEYEGHVLNCIPDFGNVRRFKYALFLKCVIEGTVSRLTKQRLVAEKRPTIIIHKATPLEDDGQYSLKFPG
ncbi:hypothetical protein Q9Q94_09940 [Uliginosibacterium sp. 31-16]|uniref:hypothetical protein n=1 Tax=Uliginosibacterium sp. 31-16 TaxID=3068315 RepID=UPI00273EC4D3|nr:hypothetical protein [Uliginosibacterium sp. 31-16]MDP5239854.1 hypothetical protein [Uliginosibacterium sp. 31-16]